jgi:hypothetical protein
MSALKSTTWKWHSTRTVSFSAIDRSRFTAFGQHVAKRFRGRFLYDTGAYTPWGPVVPLLTAVNIPGPYKVRNYKVECDIIYTNTVPTAPVRGAGRPQACYVCERLLDAAARELKMDAAELRRRNLIQAHEYPYELGFISRDGTKRKYDSGDVPALMERALQILGYDARREEQRKAHAEGRYVGIGIACCVEDTGLLHATGDYRRAIAATECQARALRSAQRPSSDPDLATLAVQAKGASVKTVEGLAGKDGLHPLQKAFKQHHALQCGFCTPGFLVTAAALLETISDPTELQVREWLSGNICRCTGYQFIVDAVLSASKDMNSALR